MDDDTMSGADGGQSTSVGIVLGKLEVVLSQVAADVRDVKAEQAETRKIQQGLSTTVAVMSAQVDRHEAELVERRASSRWTVWVPAAVGVVSLLSAGAAVVVTVVR